MCRINLIWWIYCLKNHSPQSWTHMLPKDKKSKLFNVCIFFNIQINWTLFNQSFYVLSCVAKPLNDSLNHFDQTWDTTSTVTCLLRSNMLVRLTDRIESIGCYRARDERTIFDNACVVVPWKTMMLGNGTSPLFFCRMYEKHPIDSKKRTGRK